MAWHKRRGQAASPDDFPSLSGTRSGCNSSDHLVTSLWEYYALTSQCRCMEVHARVIQARASLMVYIALFLFRSQTRSQVFFSTNSASKVNSQERVSPIKQLALYYFFLQLFQEWNFLLGTGEPQRMGTERAMRPSEMPFHLVCTRSNWPK